MLRPHKRAVLMAALLIALTNSALALTVVGGDPPDVAYLPIDPDYVLPRSDLAITSEGVLFAVVVRNYPYDLLIVRSDDSGRSWSEWDVLADPGGRDVHYPNLEVTTSAGSELLVIGYTVSGTDPEIWIGTTDATDPVPAWNRVLVESIVTGPGQYITVEDLSLATRASELGAATIGLAYWRWIYGDEYALHYVVSLDGGLTFEPPVTLATVADQSGTTLATMAEVGFGVGDIVHVAAMRVEKYGIPETSKLNLLTATNDGQTLANWDAPGTLLVDRATAELTEIGLACDPLGDDVVVGIAVGVSGVDDFSFKVSTNSGVTWTPGLFADTPDFSDLDLTWTALGPMATGFRDSTYFTLQSASGSVGPYEATPFMRCYTTFHYQAQIVLDPTQGNQIAMLATMVYDAPNYGQEALWFSAEWRDATGYANLLVNWEQQLGDVYDRYLGAPGVADLDGDDLLEIVIASASDTLWAYRGGPGLDRTYDMGAAGPSSVPVILDLDGDDDLEIAIGGADGWLHILDHGLIPHNLTPINLGTGSDVYVSAGPVTGFNAGEIVAVSGPDIHLLNSQGHEQTGWPGTAPGGTAVGRAAIGDVDGDAQIEVVVAMTTGVFILDSGANIERSLPSTVAPAAGVTLVDIDDDGDLELAVPMSDGTVRLIHHDGTSFGPGWPYNTGTGSPVSSVTAAEVWGPTDELLCFATQSGDVFAVDGDGDNSPGFPVAIAAGDTISSEPILSRVALPAADYSQILVGTADGWLYEWRTLGLTPADWPNYYDLTPALSPVAADVNSDGFAEIVLAVGHKIHVLSTGTADLRQEDRRWPMAGHDLARSGCSDCLPVTPTAVPEPAVKTRVAFTGVYPNPMPGRTAFSFALPVADEVELAVYDVRGRRVRSFGRQDLGEGQHQVTWDGRDEHGATVASGVYLARLVVGSGVAREVLTRSVVLQR